MIGNILLHIPSYGEGQADEPSIGNTIDDHLKVSTPLAFGTPTRLTTSPVAHRRIGTSLNNYQMLEILKTKKV